MMVRSTRVKSMRARSMRVRSMRARSMRVKSTRVRGMREIEGEDTLIAFGSIFMCMRILTGNSHPSLT